MVLGNASTSVGPKIKATKDGFIVLWIDEG